MNDDTLIVDAVDNPLLEGYDLLLFLITFKPLRPDDTLADVAGLFTQYSFVNTTATVDAISDLLQRRANGETVFYNIYTEAEEAADPSLEDTGLFIFPVQGVPEDTRPRVAVCSAGDGFIYVGFIHSSTPHALWLSRHGYTASALQYRPGLRDDCADLARVVSFIHSRTNELGMDPVCYSLWGGSAGACLATSLGFHDPSRFGGDDVPGPGITTTQYTRFSEISGTEPPTYAYVGTANGIAPWRVVQTRTGAIAAAGTPSEFHAYDDLPHGFGLGIGTAAEGWIEDAVAFWQARTNTAGP